MDQRELFHLSLCKSSQMKERGDKRTTERERWRKGKREKARTMWKDRVMNTAKRKGNRHQQKKRERAHEMWKENKRGRKEHRGDEKLKESRAVMESR